MSSVRRILVVAVIAMAAVFVSLDSGHSYSYGAWVGMTGENTIAWNPFLSGALDGTSLTDWENLVEFGISPMSDIFLSLSADPWGMVRYDFSGNNVGIAALYADSGSLGLQYHMITALADIFTLEANVAFSFPYSDSIGDTFGAMSIGAIIAPVLTFSDNVAFYLEIDPSYDLGAEAFDLGLVPGLWFAVGGGELSVGFPISGLTDEGDISVSYGAWYWIPFTVGGGGGEAEPEPAPEPAPAE